MTDFIAESSLYRAVWRWHFYAGLLVLPILILLAVTGALYLFQPELDRVIYRRFIEVPAQTSPRAVPSAVMATIEVAMHGRVLEMTLPDRPDRSIKMLVRVASGEARTAYADPYDGHFLGATAFGGVMQTVRKVHSLQLFGFWASSLVEVAAGWAIILAATGVVLWWPRGRRGGVVTIRGTPKRRTFWRDLHAVTGILSAGIIVFLAVTGMPWSMFWGNKVQQWATAANLSRPAPPVQVTPSFLLSATLPGASHDAHNKTRGTTPWALEQFHPPASTAPSTTPEVIGLDRAVERFGQIGIPKPLAVQLPEGVKGAYMATYTPDRVGDARTVYLDQYSGKVLADIGFAQYGPVAKAVEWGIAVHQGQEYGAVNRYLMLAGCVAILLLAISAPVMWWKRRPPGKLGAPPVPTDRRTALAVLATIAIVGIIYPLVGVSLLGALAVDGTWRRLSARKRLAAM